MSDGAVGPAENGLEELLSDAKTIAAYGARAGRLRNSDLFNAIRNFEATSSKAWGTAEATNLLSAVNQATNDIVPATLLDLRTSNPFASEQKNKTARYILIALSIMLMALTAQCTIFYNRGAELVTRLVQINQDKPAEKMGAIARSWRAANLEKSVDGEIAGETYYQLLDEVRELDNKVKSYVVDYGNFSGDFFTLQSYAHASTGSATQGKVDPRNSPNVQCDEPTATQKVVSSFEQSPPGSVLAANRALILNFACAESLMISPYSMPVLNQIGGEVSHKIGVLSQWILPGLYGALGALIFYLRQILNPILPDPPFEKIVHRVALGGFAGIIFAWFWAPKPDAMGDFNVLTINSFTVAFLIGFSIDVFFTALDRIVMFLQGVIAQPRTAETISSATAASQQPATDAPAPSPPPN
ncbi:hypothetical protein AB9F47_30505 [Rhizobium leguminosarum]|uniref:hypothetical protein n=1 Tax=Rhizobium leguminosarum TaxID=384 RepID=UPI003F9AC93D